MTGEVAPALDIVELSADETHPLRRAVLRNGDHTAAVVFHEDAWPGVFHLGARTGTTLVGVSTWIPRPAPAEPGDDGGGDGVAVQLRGMATAHGWRSSGVGGLLLEAGCARCGLEGFELVWARARDAALAFYGRHGFQVVGDGFIDATTQLPHHLVHRALR